MKLSSPKGRPWLGAALIAGCLLAVLLASRPADATGSAPRPSFGPAPVDFGGGAVEPGATDELSPDERTAIESLIAANVAQLEQEGRLPAARSADHVTLGWPLSPRDGFSDPGYHGVTGYVDHDPAYPGHVRDYSCGARSYDSSSGYNHQGTDYFLWPFPWNKMAAGDIRVVAVADGVIVGRHEGYPDQSCSPNGNRWNAVYVRHADGSIAWYGHLKLGSVTTKPVGAAVVRGEVLGLVGSSGNSSGPHLHFEMYNGGALLDPYAGSCNALDGGWWEMQRPYYDAAINKLTTGTAPVERSACPAPDIPHEAALFQPGDRVTFTAYYRDQLDSLPSIYRILTPNGAVFAQWTHSSTRPHSALSYWYWAYVIPATAPTGTWRFEVDFNGRAYSHAFVVGAPSTPTPTATPTRPWLPSDFIFMPSVTRG
ncbi:MAG: peptidoglycan DD-metalloendopeptidase family protein [Candidatus Promineofilum sp.]|nr:peptidoglycan DD-metalloendopeptidase family protein [Promineifilum sp.]